MKFLNGPNDSFSQVKTHILMMELVLSIDKAFSLVIQEERQRSSEFNVTPFVESAALVVKNQSFNQGSSSGSNGKNFKGNVSKGRPVCSHCGRIGHIMEKCYKLVGFPPGYKQKGRITKANQVMVDDDQGQYESAHQNSSFLFTSEQYQQLPFMLNSHASTSANSNDVAIHTANSALLGNLCAFLQDSMCLNMEHSVFSINPVNKTDFGKNTWVLDNGAIYHIVHSVTLFTKITSSITSFVQLPNGERVVVIHIFTIQVTANLVLENVLCVPSFTFFLISISQLTKCLSCCFVFLSNLCFIQDLSCWKTIGVGKLHNNLYLLQSSASCKSVSVVSSILGSVFSSFVNNVFDVPVTTKPFLWHLRLGHVSDAILHALHDSIPNVINVHSNKGCTLCPIAKQKRLPFPFFNYLSKNAFDLVHYDVWGPFAKVTHDGFRYFLTIVNDATRSTWVYLMKSKSETRPLLISFYKMIST